MEFEDSKVKEYGPFFGSLIANLISEFGDKTFIVAAVMAMKFNRYAVYIGASGALVVMTVLACLFGHLVNEILNPTIICLIAGWLFLFFGIKMIKDANNISQHEEEEKEAEDEVR